MSGQINVKNFQDRITFLKKQSGVNPQNGQPYTSKDVEPVFSCWCQVWNMSISNQIAALETHFENSVTFVLRQQHKFEITMDMLIEYRSDKYTILTIDPDTGTSKEFQRVIAKKVSK